MPTENTVEEHLQSLTIQQGKEGDGEHQPNGHDSLPVVQGSNPGLDGSGIAADIEKKYDLIRFTFSDIHGIGRCRVVPSKHFNRLSNDGMQIFCGGVGFGPRSNYVAHEEILTFKHGNAVMRPDLSTLAPLPWAKAEEFRVGEVLCETFWGPSYKQKFSKKPKHLEKCTSEASKDNKDNACNNVQVTETSAKKEATPEEIIGHLKAAPQPQIAVDNGDLVPQAACPRFVARRLLQRLENDFGLRLYSGFEAEYICYKKGSLQHAFEDNDVCSTYDTSEFESYLGQIYTGLSGAGVEVEALQTEYESGQFELALAPVFGIAVADAMFRLKAAVKEISRHHGLEATFMTRPDHSMKTSGTGLHFSHSLIDKSSGLNVMHDVTKRDISDVMRHWLAGLLKHSRALTALCCPTYNCYRRLHIPPAPCTVSWGHDDRFASYRVKSSPGCSYLESRLPSGAANPYIVVAATVAAGMSGLRDQLTLQPENTGTEENLPKSLEEALTALEQDTVMVDALGEEFIKWFLKIKRDIEITKLKDNRIELERDMYMKLL